MPDDRIDLDDNGEIDDVALHGVECFRLERMDGDAWCVCAYRPDGSYERFWLRRSKKHVACYHESGR